MNINSDCSNFNDLPDISIILKARKDFKGKELVTKKIILHPEDYVIDGKKVKSKMGRNKFLYNSQNLDCSPAIMAIDVPAPRGPIFVFGDYFLRKFYTVFDRDQKVVGISRANHESDIDVESHLNKISTPYDDAYEFSEIQDKLSNQIENDISNSKLMMKESNKSLNMTELIERLNEESADIFGSVY